MLPPAKAFILGATMRWIYISPHLDDAVLSCGGLIWEQTHSGIPVEIWTLMAGSPPPGTASPLIERVQAEWKIASPQEAVSLRRAEDNAAARRVGANIRHFDLPDAIYRRAPEGDLLYTQEIFTPIHERDTLTITQAAQLLQKHLTQYDTIVCPLAIGSHVDHLLTRAAVEMLQRPLWYYADVPYVFRHPKAAHQLTRTMSPKPFFLSAPGIDAWLEGIAAYPSQISSLFTDEADMRQTLRQYAQSGQGATLWETPDS